MTHTHICDRCGNTIRGVAIEIACTMDGHPTVFLDGSWNGGEFCSRKCAIEMLERVKDPAHAAKER